MSGRVKGNFYKALGATGNGISEGGRSGKFSRDGVVSDTRPTCFNCGKQGHRAAECRSRRAGSPNVDRVTGPACRTKRPPAIVVVKRGIRVPTAQLEVEVERALSQ